MSRVQGRHSAPVPPAQKRSMLIYGTIALIVVGVVIAIGYASRVPQIASTAPTFADIKVGQAAPAFTAATTAGPFDSAKSGGKPMFLEVFATWCPHCQEEVPVINDLYAKYKGRVNFIGVSGSEYGMDSSAKESQNDVYEFTQKFKVNYPVAFDPDLSVAKKYLQGGFPTLVIVGRSGKITDVESGAQPKSLLQGKIEAALK